MRPSFWSRPTSLGSFSHPADAGHRDGRCQVSARSCGQRAQQEVVVITELRRYRIRDGKMASWVEFFREAARRNEAGGSQVEFVGVDPETGTFIWLRTYAD